MELGEKQEPLNLDEIQKLDPANRTDYLALRRMFESDGWRLFLQWLNLSTQNLMQRQLDAKTWDDVLLARGGFISAQTCASIENITEVTYRNIVENADSLEETLTE